MTIDCETTNRIVTGADTMKLFRKCYRDILNGKPYTEYWALASARTNWKLEINIRHRPSEITDPDRTVSILTDLEIPAPRNNGNDNWMLSETPNDCIFPIFA